MKTPRIQLLVDLNGTMGYRSEVPISGVHAPCIRKKYFYVRPDAASFLEEMSKYFEVCILTSVMAHNALDMCLTISPNYKKYITKIYDRDFNKKDPNGVEKWDTIRDLEKIMKFNKRDLSKIIMLDNESRKFEETPFNGIVVPEYGPTQIKRGDKITLAIISTYLKNLTIQFETEGNDVREYIKNHPLHVNEGKTELAKLTAKIAKVEICDDLDFNKYGSVSMRFVESKCGVMLFKQASLEGTVMVKIENSNAGHFVNKMQLARLVEEGGESCKIWLSDKLVPYNLNKCKTFLLKN